MTSNVTRWRHCLLMPVCIGLAVRISPGCAFNFHEHLHGRIRPVRSGLMVSRPGSTRCQLQTLSTDCMVLTMCGFDVHRSSDSVSIASRDHQAGSDTWYSLSKFKIQGGAGRSTRGGQDLLLERFDIQHAGHGQQKPSPHVDGARVIHRDLKQTTCWSAMWTT